MWKINDTTAVDRPSVDDIVTWFNAWLEQPITERERVIIGEVFHAIDYPGDVRRAVSRNPAHDTEG